jgi:hypothetical protein
LKRAEGIVEILEAFDLTGSFRAAAELAGCSHHTVARYVRLRAAGRVLTERAARDRLIDGFLAKVEEWVERSKGRVRADVVHDKLLAQGFEGSERTTRRAVARASGHTPRGTGGCTGRGSRSPRCGSSSTGEPGPGSAAGRRCSGARG